MPNPTTSAVVDELERVRLGHVHKYADRTVAVHLLRDGAPVCGTRVDRDALENHDGVIGDITCTRCIRRNVMGHQAAHADRRRDRQAAAAVLTETERDALIEALPTSIGRVGLKWCPGMFKDNRVLTGYGEELMDALTPVVGAIVAARLAAAGEQ